MKRLKGIYQNCDPVDQPEGYYRDAKNIILDEEVGTVLNEKGTSVATTIPSGARIIGSYLLTNDEIIVFLSNNTIAKIKDGAYEQIAQSEVFNFSQDYPIQADLYTDKHGDRVLVWVDGNNNARFLNIDDVGPISSTTLNLFPSITSAPQMTVESVNNTGGNLDSGTYYIAIAYKHEDGTLTNFYDVVGPIQIVVDDIDDSYLFRGSREGLKTSKSISVSFTDSDTEYESIQLAVIPVYGGVIDTVQLLPEIPINTTTYTYTGNESFSVGSLEEIQIDQIFYSKPETIHINSDTIYMGNLAQKPDIGAQSFVNDITVRAVEKTLSNSLVEGTELNGLETVYEQSNSFRNPVNSIYNKSFKRGEVYALYISFLLKEGGESKAYHIPGRPPEAGETDNDDFRYFATLPEFPEFPPRRMGYWENKNETYPNDPDEWGALAGQNVRHHHFPDHQVSPLYKEVNGELRLNVLGFVLDDLFIPQDIKDQITGYKIYYAKRTDTNRRILGQTTNIQSRVDAANLRPETRNEGTFGTSDGVIDPLIHYLHPYKLLRTRESISPITHLKAVTRYNDQGDIFLDNEGGITASFTKLVRQNANPVQTSDRLKQVEALSYVDSQETESNINLTNQGFNINFDNNRGESKVVVKIDSEYDPAILNLSTPGQGIAYYLIDLFSYKEDVYNSFDNQILVSTNYIETDLSQTNTEAIFGGDTYLNIHTYRANKRYDDQSYSNIYMQLVESDDNISYRRVGDNPWEGFYYHFGLGPASALAWKDGDPFYGGSFSDVDVFTFDNYYFYNEDYSHENDIRFPELKSKFNPQPETYPTRIIRGKGNTRDSPRTFLPNDFIDLSTKRGDLVKLSTYNNILIPHMERSLIRTRGREELQVGDIRAFLGSGDIFSVKPEEIIYSEDGFGGIEKKEHSLSTPFGYVFYDKDESKVYLINNEGMNDIGEPIKPYLDELNPIKTLLGYDPLFERLFITFNNQTWSYSFKIKGWISQHSFVPDFYLSNKRHMFTSKATTIYKHNNGLRGRYYQTNHPSEYSYIDNRSANVSKMVMSLMIQSTVESSTGDTLLTKTFDQFRIRNSIQDTGVIDIEYFANNPTNPYIGNARRTTEKWFINQFRDITAIPDGTPAEDEWKYKKKLQDHFHRVDLIKDNASAEKITLTDTDLVYKNSIR